MDQLPVVPPEKMWEKPCPECGRRVKRKMVGAGKGKYRLETRREFDHRKTCSHKCGIAHREKVKAQPFVRPTSTIDAFILRPASG